MQISTTDGFGELVRIIARLRAPDGCPWDRQQTHASLTRYITEEAAEAVDAIECDDLASLKEELGDLLLQVLLQAQIASEAAEFSLAEVIDGIARKLLRRHPHVFGSDVALAASGLSAEERKTLEAQIAAADSPEAVLKLWDNIKLLEKGHPASHPASHLADPASPAVRPPSLLAGVPSALPALMQAQDISRKAISVGFDWGSVEAVWQQVESELGEFKAEASGSTAAADEFGDVLFSLVNVALKEGIDAESALRGTIRRFRLRWAIMENHAFTAGRELSSYPTAELERLWQQAKQDLSVE